MDGGGSFRNLANATVSKKLGGAGVKTRLDVFFENRGTLRLGGHHIQFERALTQVAGAIADLQGGKTELGAAGLILNGGQLRGGGEIIGNVTANGGVVLVGDNADARTLKITGDYTQNAGAGLQVLAAYDLKTGKELFAIKTEAANVRRLAL